MDESLKKRITLNNTIGFFNDIKTHHKETIVEVATGTSKIKRKTNGNKS